MRFKQPAITDRQNERNAAPRRVYSRFEDDDDAWILEISESLQYAACLSLSTLPLPLRGRRKVFDSGEFELRNERLNEL